MFGYVRPRTDRLTEAEQEVYREAYCGLCRALGQQYGFFARFLVNYDMSFLYLLRASMRAPAPVRNCWCPGRVCGKKSCTVDPEGFETVAACTVILCMEKLRDNVCDEGASLSLPALPARLSQSRRAASGLCRPYGGAVGNTAGAGAGKQSLHRCNG